MQDKVGEYPTIPVTDETADHKQGIVAQMELDFVKGLHTLVERFVHVLELDFASGHIEPFNVILSEEHILRVTGSAGFRLADATGIEYALFRRTRREGLFGFITVKTAGSHRHAGNGYRHHPSDGFVILHILQSYNKRLFTYIVRRTAKRLHGYHVNLMPSGRENVNGCSVRKVSMSVFIGI